VPAGGTGIVTVTWVRVAAFPVRGPPTAIAPANVGCPSSSASAAVKKYFDLTPTHSNGPSNNARWPGLSLEKIGALGFGRLRDDGVVPEVVQRIFLRRA